MIRHEWRKPMYELQQAMHEEIDGRFYLSTSHWGMIELTEAEIILHYYG